MLGFDLSPLSPPLTPHVSSVPLLPALIFANSRLQLHPDVRSGILFSYYDGTASAIGFSCSLNGNGNDILCFVTAFLWSVAASVIHSLTRVTPALACRTGHSLWYDPSAVAAIVRMLPRASAADFMLYPSRVVLNSCFLVTLYPLIPAKNKFKKRKILYINQKNNNSRFQGFIELFAPGARKRSYNRTRHSLWTSTWVLLINNYHTLYYIRKKKKEKKKKKKCWIKCPIKAVINM